MRIEEGGKERNKGQEEREGKKGKETRKER